MLQLTKRLRELTMDQVISYVETIGWNWRHDIEQDALVFFGPNDDSGRPVFRVIPSAAADIGFLPRMEDLVRTLASIDNVPIDSIVDRISSIEDLRHRQIEVNAAVELPKPVMAFTKLELFTPQIRSVCSEMAQSILDDTLKPEDHNDLISNIEQQLCELMHEMRERIELVKAFLVDYNTNDGIPKESDVEIQRILESIILDINSAAYLVISVRPPDQQCPIRDALQSLRNSIRTFGLARPRVH